MGGEYHGWLNCSGFLRDPLEYSRILSNPPEYGTRERNATKMGRQCDDGGGNGGMWRTASGYGVAGGWRGGNRRYSPAFDGNRAGFRARTGGTEIP